MKKIVFLLLFPLLSYSQNFGVYSEKGIFADPKENLPEEKWFWTNDYEFTMLFPYTPVGLKHMHEKIEAILKLNGMEDSDPAWDKSYINPEFEDEEDYAKIHSHILNGEGEIKAGYRYKGQELVITAAKYEYKLMLRKT